MTWRSRFNVSILMAIYRSVQYGLMGSTIPYRSVWVGICRNKRTEIQVECCLSRCEHCHDLMLDIQVKLPPGYSEPAPKWESGAWPSIPSRTGIRYTDSSQTSPIWSEKDCHQSRRISTFQKSSGLRRLVVYNSEALLGDWSSSSSTACCARFTAVSTVFI